MNGVSPSGPGSQAAPEAVPSSPSVSIPDAGRIVLGQLSQPMRNGSCEVVMCWEAAIRPVKVCEGGGWYSSHPTDSAWVMIDWLEHKGRPGYEFAPVAEEHNTDLEEMVWRRARAVAKTYGFDLAQGMETQRAKTAGLGAEHDSPVACDALKIQSLEAQIVSLREELAKAEAELERRDRNETRNCLNWGPCSHHDGSMSEPGAALSSTGEG